MSEVPAAKTKAVVQLRRRPETKRCTYYIYNEEDEALRILSFYYDKPISEIVRTILHNGILKMAEDINLPNIFDIACQRLAGNTNPPLTEYDVTN